MGVQRVAWVAVVVVVSGCGEPREQPFKVARQPLGVTHTVCSPTAPSPCEYPSPAACAVGATVTDGDLCLVLGGEYHELVTWQAGSLNQGLTFRCAPGFHCLIDGDHVRASAFDGYDDWVIEGFELTGTLSDAVTAVRRVAGVRDCFIHDVRGRAVSQLAGVNASTHAVFERNVVMNTASDGVVCVTNPLGTVLVRNNLIVDPSLGAGGRGVSCPGNSLVTHNSVDARNRTAPYADPSAAGITAAVARFNVVAGGSTSLTANQSRDHNLAFAWSSTAFGGAGDAGVPVTDTTGDPRFLGPEDWRLAAGSPAIDAGVGSTETEDLLRRPRDVVPDLGAYEFDALATPVRGRWPLREQVAAPAQASSVALALRGGPDGGPVVAYLDTTAASAVFRARNADGTWRSETVQSGLGTSGLFAGNITTRLMAVGVEPVTGLPVVVYPHVRLGNVELHLARRLGDACGTGCASNLWTGCALPPVMQAPTSASLSFRLAFEPVSGRPAVVVWQRTPNGCGSAAADSLMLYQQQANGTWAPSLVGANTCGVNFLPPTFDVAFTPAGVAEVVFTRTTSLSATNATGELLLATNASGSFMAQVVPLPGLVTAYGSAVQVAMARRGNGDLGVLFRGLAGTAGMVAFIDRVSGVWQAPVNLGNPVGLAAMTSADVAWGPGGEPEVVFAFLGSLEHGRRLPQRFDPDAGVLAPRWDVRSIDTQKDTGLFATLAMLADGGAVVVAQQDTPTKVIKLLATTDPGGVALSVVDPVTCDQCPADPAKTVPGVCGCGYQENPGISISDATVSEGDTGTTQLTFTVTLNHACGANVSVNWVTANGTATSGSDYNSTAGTVLFLPDQVSRTVTVNVLGDTAFEGNETVLVNLSGASAGSSLVDAQGVGTIVNDDPAPDAGAGGGSAGGGSAGGGSAGGSAAGGSAAGGSAGGGAAGGSAGGGAAGGSAGGGAAGGSAAGGSAAGGSAGGGAAGGSAAGGSAAGGSAAGGSAAGGSAAGGSSAGGSAAGGSAGGGSAGGGSAGGGSAGGGSAGGGSAGGGSAGGGSAGGGSAGGGSAGGSAAGGSAAGGSAAGGSAAGGSAGGGSAAGGSAAGGSAAGGSAAGGSAAGGSAAGGSAGGAAGGGSAAGGSAAGGSASAGGTAGGEPGPITAKGCQCNSPAGDPLWLVLALLMMARRPRAT